MHQSSATTHRIAIIGAGFGGIGAAIRLRQRGETDFVVFDKAGGVGGTWWVNRYPGCACDVPSHLYSFSFEPNPDWTRRFSPRAEIQTYLQGLVKRHRLDEHIRLNTRIVRAEWDAGAGQWKIEDANGHRWSARVLVTALGGLSRPAWPDIAGLESFAGQKVHSQQWDDTIDLAGQRVAVIGTGASAVQLIPEAARQASALTIFQRTPNWIIPRPDRVISPRRRALYRRFPCLQRLARLILWTNAEMRVPAFLWWRHLAAGHRLLAHRHRRRQIDDPETARRMKPEYDIGCKRVLLSSDFYPVLNQDHVALVTAGIERIEPDAVIDRRGDRYPVNTLILATGFRATEPVPEGMIIGRGGLDLARAWRDGPEAYKGTAVAGFPNLFMLLGPNTALGHSSVILMIESQINYVLHALDHMARQDIEVIEVNPAFQQHWNDKLARRLSGSVWNSGGCNSWYRHPGNRRNTTLWPGFTMGFRRQLRRFDPNAYKLAS